MNSFRSVTIRQKAPSAKRCIKTRVDERVRTFDVTVRKHRAPKGALRLARAASDQFGRVLSQKAPSAKRCIKTDEEALQIPVRNKVRKHRAPKGALRPELLGDALPHPLECQKAPSAKRCIKTVSSMSTAITTRCGQKAPSAKRCIKTCWQRVSLAVVFESQSTERQKVH